MSDDIGPMKAMTLDEMEAVMMRFAAKRLDDAMNDFEFRTAVDARISAAVAAEREACAKVAEDPYTYNPDIAAAIRARGAK